MRIIISLIIFLLLLIYISMNIYDGNEMLSSSNSTCSQKVEKQGKCISSSENTLKKGALTTFSRSRDYKLFPAGTWNQSSDRISKHFNTNVIPSRGNSTNRSKLSSKPGSQSAGGLGIDIKHNSYSRYFNRRKGYSLNKRCNCV